MVKHPNNRAERLRLKRLKDERKPAPKAPEEKASRVWRKRTKEEIKARETEHDLHDTGYLVEPGSR